MEERLEKSQDVKQMEKEVAEMQQEFYEKYKGIDFLDLEELITNVMLTGLETGYKLATNKVA